MRRVLLALAALLGLSGQAHAADAPIVDGVWQGTIGTLPVRVCLMDAGASWPHGSYYYLSQLKPIPLTRPEGSKEWTEDSEGKARWAIASVTAKAITGTWTDGTKSLPIKLTRVAMGDDGELDGACNAAAFLAPRIVPAKVVPVPAKAGRFAYTKLEYRVGKSFADVDLSTMQVPATRPGDAAINAALRKLIDPKAGWVDYLGCMQGSIGLSGNDGEMSMGAEPTFVSPDWIGVEVSQGGFCGGAHPYYSSEHRLFDRVSGKEVQLATWLAPKGMTAKWDAGAAYWETTLLDPLRQLVIKAMPPVEDADCATAIAEAGSWDLALTPGGISFSPSLPHVSQGCVDSGELSFAKLAPYLSPAGKAGAARMKAAVLVP